MRIRITSGQFTHRRVNGDQLFSALLQTNDVVKAALAVLYQAYQYSIHTKLNRWQFAVEIDELLSLGLTRSDLRWLVAVGFVLHAGEFVEPARQTRKFAALGVRPFLRTSCFVLSDDGIIAISRPTSGEPNQRTTLATADPNGSLPRPGHVATARHPIPQWNYERRALLLHGLVIKQFRGPAANQEWILRAFHEEQWTVRIDDPLPPITEKDSQRRLNDAIKNLNRHQVHPLVAFRGDGTGRGILWELRDSALDVVLQL